MGLGMCWRDWGAEARRTAWDGALAGFFIGLVFIGAVFGDWFDETDHPAAALLLLLAIYAPGPAAGALVGAAIGLKRQCRTCKGHGRNTREGTVCEACDGTGRSDRPNGRTTMEQRTPHAAVWLVPVTLLVLALFPWPYGYYEFLRICICGASAFLAYTQWKGARRLDAWSIMLGMVVVLYNPVKPIHMNDELWSVLDLATAALFIAHMRRTRRNARENLETQARS